MTHTKISLVEGEKANEYLSFQQVVKLLNVKESMLRGLVFRKEIPYVKIGRLLRFNKEDIMGWLESKTVKNEEED